MQAERPPKGGASEFQDLIRISIPAAFEAIAATLQLGSVGYEPELNAKGERLTDPIMLDALNDAERRGVAIRIVLDPRERHDFVKLSDLSDNVRIKVHERAAALGIGRQVDRVLGGCNESGIDRVEALLGRKVNLLRFGH